MTAMTSAPAIVPEIVPEPPNRLAPPMTTAAIESSSSGSPACGAPAVKRPVYSAPGEAGHDRREQIDFQRQRA